MKNRMRERMRSLAIGWIVFVPLAMIIQVITYSGIYRWLCEWQLAFGGEYDGFMSAAVPGFVLVVPAVVYLRHIYQRSDAPQPKAIPEAEAKRRALAVLATVAAIGLTVCVGALAWAWHLPDRSGGPSVDVDLAKLGNAAPPLGRVTLIGAIDPAYVARKTFSGKVAVDGAHMLYAPMIIPGSARRARIFVYEYAGGEMTKPLPTDGGKRFKGVLVEGGMPFDMVRQFDRLGAPVAAPYYLLITSPDGARGPFYEIALLAGLFGLLGLLPLLAIRLQPG